MEKLLYQGNARSNLLYLASITIFGIGATLQSLKVHPELALLNLCFWLFMAVRPFSGSKILICASQNTLIITRRFLYIPISKTKYSLDSFYGIRNRMHWGFGKSCRTELLQRDGKHLAIRIEPFSLTISEEASDFKAWILNSTKLESRPDYNHV